MEGIQALLRGLTEASASLFYHLLVGLALEGLLLMALDLRRRSGRGGLADRLMAAAGLGLMGRLILFGAAFGETRGLPPGTLLPPLERAVDLATWGWLGWAMAGAGPGLWAPALHTVLVLGAYGATAPAWWSLALQDPTAVYVTTPPERAWTLWALGLNLAIGGLLLSQRPRRFPTSGALGFSLLALGALLQLNAPLLGTHLSPWIRLGALAAYPLWLAGTYQLALDAAWGRPSAMRQAASAWPAWTASLLQALQDREVSDPFREALRMAREWLGARWTGIGLLQEDHLVFIAREGENLPRAGSDLVLTLSEYPRCQEAIDQRRGDFMTPADQAGEAFLRLWQAFGMERIGSLQVEPLVVSDQVLGLWLIGYPPEAGKSRPPDPGLAREMAGALARTLRLFREWERLTRLEAALQALEQERQEAIRQLEARLEEERRSLQREIHRWATRAAEAEEERERWRRRAEELAQLLEARAALPVAAASVKETPSESGEERDGLVLALLQELRTPLTAILGYTDLLLGEAVGILGATQRQFLLRIRANIERMAGLIRETLQIAALEAGSYRLEPGPLRLEEVRDEALQQLQPVLQERGLRVELEWPEDLPPVRLDRDAGQQILYHLLNNAALCSRPGTAIVLRARRNPSIPDVLFLSVRDTGGGIPVEEIPRVFVPRYRATTPLIPGVGDSIGLSIARALVEASGGRIWVESEPGVGSTFTVVLPLAVS